MAQPRRRLQHTCPTKPCRYQQKRKTYLYSSRPMEPPIARIHSLSSKDGESPSRRCRDPQHVNMRGIAVVSSGSCTARHVLAASTCMITAAFSFDLPPEVLERGQQTIQAAGDAAWKVFCTQLESCHGSTFCPRSQNSGATKGRKDDQANSAGCFSLSSCNFSDPCRVTPCTVPVCEWLNGHGIAVGKQEADLLRAGAASTSGKEQPQELVPSTSFSGYLLLIAGPCSSLYSAEPTHSTRRLSGLLEG